MSGIGYPKPPTNYFNNFSNAFQGGSQMMQGGSQLMNGANMITQQFGGGGYGGGGQFGNVGYGDAGQFGSQQQQQAYNANAFSAGQALDGAMRDAKMNMEVSSKMAAISFATSMNEAVNKMTKAAGDAIKGAV